MMSPRPYTTPPGHGQRPPRGGGRCPYWRTGRKALAMGPVKAIKTCLRNSFRFSGRASRSELWWAWAGGLLLFTMIVRLEIALLGKGSIGFTQVGDQVRFGVNGNGPFSTAAALLMLLPLFSACVRRLHDQDRAGWWLGAPFLLFGLALVYALVARATGTTDANGTIHFKGLAAVPLVVLGLGGFAILIWNFISLVRPSQPGPNRFGPNPLEVTP